ncbi:MAG TPA: hypothetical protein VIY29_18840 [Ktedonobacteraceae bacterium]
MIRLRADWLLWAVFIISLALVAYTYFSGQKPSQIVVMIQLLGLGCGLIAMLRRRRGEK